MEKTNLRATWKESWEEDELALSSLDKENNMGETWEYKRTAKMKNKKEIFIQRKTNEGGSCSCSVASR